VSLVRDRAIRAIGVAAAAALVFAFWAANWRGGQVTLRWSRPALPSTTRLHAPRTTWTSPSPPAARSSIQWKRSAIDTALSIIDVSIRQTEHALAADPSDRFLADYLGRLKQKRIAALRDVFDMIRSGP
jgi:hypothetical protein